MTATNPNQGLSLADGSRLSIKWIVAPRVDLPCFIGGALLGYGMFYLHAGLHWNMLTVWFVWYCLLDSPHFFGTYSRTYLDKEEMRNRRRLLIGSLGLLLVGPAMILLSGGLYKAGVPGYQWPYQALVVFVSVWAYWHVVRQHFGIMSLYKRKNGDGAVYDRVLDKWVIYIGLMAPFLAFAIRHPETRTLLGLSETVVAGGWESIVVTTTALAVAAVVCVFAIRQFDRWRTGATINVPKIMFLAAVVPLHVFVCYHPATLLAPLLGFSAFVTIFHDVQYHAIVWYYQQNRCHKSGDGGEAKYGIAAKISRYFPVYMGCAIAMGLTFGFLGCLLQINPGCIPILPSAEIALFGEMKLTSIFYGIFLGVLMHHYFVDQFIWRPSKDKGIKKDLKLEDGAQGLRS